MIRSTLSVAWSNDQLTFTASTSAMATIAVLVLLATLLRILFRSVDRRKARAQTLIDHGKIRQALHEQYRVELPDREIAALDKGRIVSIPASGAPRVVVGWADGEPVISEILKR